MEHGGTPCMHSTYVFAGKPAVPPLQNNNTSSGSELLAKTSNSGLVHNFFMTSLRLDTYSFAVWLNYIKLFL
jgi:hypothetical protein